MNVVRHLDFGGHSQGCHTKRYDVMTSVLHHLDFQRHSDLDFQRHLDLDFQTHSEDVHKTKCDVMMNASYRSDVRSHTEYALEKAYYVMMRSIRHYFVTRIS